MLSAVATAPRTPGGGLGGRYRAELTEGLAGPGSRGRVRRRCVADEGVTSKSTAEAIGAGLGMPTAAIPEAELDAHFGWIGRFFSCDAPTSSAATRELLGWEPTGPTLLDDLKAGVYTAGAVV